MKISKKQDNTKRPVTFRLSNSEYRNVTALAEDLGLRRSQVIREAVHTFIKNQQTMANNKKTRLSCLKSFICRDEIGQKRLNQNYESYQSELSRQRAENLKIYA